MSSAPNIQQYWELLANNVGFVRLHGAWEFSLSGYAFNHRICPLESFIVIKLNNKNFHRVNATARCVWSPYAANKFTSSDVNTKRNKWKQMQISVFNLITRISRFPLSYKTVFFIYYNNYLTILSNYGFLTDRPQKLSPWQHRGAYLRENVKPRLTTATATRTAINQ